MTKLVCEAGQPGAVFTEIWIKDLYNHQLINSTQLRLQGVSADLELHAHFQFIYHLPVAIHQHSPPAKKQ